MSSSSVSNVLMLLDYIRQIKCWYNLSAKIENSWLVYLVTIEMTEQKGMWYLIKTFKCFVVYDVLKMKYDRIINHKGLI